MKNKTKLLFAGILAAFLMLAVPFAIVSFDSDDVDASNVSETVDTVNGYLLVGDVSTLEKALEDRVPKIKLMSNFEYSGSLKTFTISSPVEIDGSNVPLNYIRFNIGENKEYNKDATEFSGIVTLKNLHITNATDSGNVNRAVSVMFTDNVDLNIIGCKFNTKTYAVNVTGQCGSIDVVIDDSEISGYCAIQTWAEYADINVTNSTLVGNNIQQYHETNSFSTIMINRDSSADITIIDSDIKTLSVNGNEQRAVYFNTGSDGSLKISGDSTIKMDAPGDAMVFLNEGIDVDLESLTLTTTKNENLIYTKSDIKFGSGFETDKLLEVSVCSDVNLIGSPNNSFHGLTVESYDEGDYDVVIDGINSVGAGIAVFGADVVNIQNCNVYGVNEELHPYSYNIFGISVSESEDVTISSNIIDGVETILNGENKYDGVGIGIYKIGKSIRIDEKNVVSNTGHNSIWIVDSINASVTIEDNEIFNWAIEGEGRAIRIQNVDSTVISNNLFSKDTVSKNLESTVKVDCKSSKKISVTFNGDILSGNTIFIDDGTTYNSLSVNAGSTYYCYDTTIISGNLRAEGDSAFHIAKGGMLSLLSGATINCTINGPGDARITFYGVAAGPGGATLTGGSIIAGGMYTSGYVTIDTPGNVLDGTFDDVDITVDDVEVEINDSVVFTNGTKVVLENGAKFTEDPVFEAGTELIIGTGPSAEVIQITETSKVSSSGIVRVGFALPIACENGTVYYEKREVMAITVFEGDSYGQYLAKLGVKADPGYFWNNVFTNEFGASVSSSSIVDEGDKLFATCYAAFSSSESDANEPAGFDIADHVVLIEAVIAVLVLVGFVAYIRKN